MKHLARFASIAIVAITCSCATDEYETGDNDFSYLKAEMAMVTTADTKTLRHAVTDSGDSLVFAPPLACSWANTADSTYRAMLYYSSEGDRSSIQGISAHQVLVLRIPQGKPENAKTDPLTIESAWIDKQRRFLNLGLYVMTGKSGDADSRQSVGVVCDTVKAATGSAPAYNITLVHNQNGVPENYSARVFASIPISGMEPGDTIRLQANTYDGTVTRCFVK